MIRFLIEKEFKQMRRNAFVPRLVVAMPLMMMLVFPWAANQEVKDVRLAVVDNDRTTASRRLVEKVAASGYFSLADVTATFPEALRVVERGRADIVLEIARGFEAEAAAPPPAADPKVMIAANAVNGTRASLGTLYLQSILSDFAAGLQAEAGGAPQSAVGLPTVSARYGFNPRLDYKVFMVPALMVMLLTMLCGFLPALGIVAEKEAGTIEQINVSPVRRLDFVLAKLIPYWIVGFAVLALCMVLAAAVYGLRPAGSPATIALFAGVYILVVSGVGLVISNHSDTMQQAMFVMFFFMMIFLLISGLFTPVGSMPGWARAVAAVNPLKYFMEVMRLVYLKGSTLGQLLPQLAALGAFAVAFNVWAVAGYRKSG